MLPISALIEGGAEGGGSCRFVLPGSGAFCAFAGGLVVGERFCQRAGHDPPLQMTTGGGAVHFGGLAPGGTDCHGALLLAMTGGGRWCKFGGIGKDNYIRQYVLFLIWMR